MQYLINARMVEVVADPRTSLLDLLRDHLGLMGTKKGCNQGACGACTVLVDGERINACLALAVQYEGRSITTVEGLGVGGPGMGGFNPEGLDSDAALHPLQAAFIEHDGFQCGYCTPGQLCSAIAMMGEIGRGVPSAVTTDLAADIITLDDDELRERMSGNLCRCGAYNGIVEAIHQVFAKVPA